MAHRHHRKDSATLFQERSLRAIKLRHLFERCLKAIVIAIAVIMVTLLILAYTVS